MGWSLQGGATRAPHHSRWPLQRPSSLGKLAADRSGRGDSRKTNAGRQLGGCFGSQERVPAGREAGQAVEARCALPGVGGETQSTGSRRAHPRPSPARSHCPLHSMPTPSAQGRLSSVQSANGAQRSEQQSAWGASGGFLEEVTFELGQEACLGVLQVE